MAGPAPRTSRAKHEHVSKKHSVLALLSFLERPLQRPFLTATVLLLPEPSLHASLKERECLVHGELDLSLVGAEVVVVSAVAPVPRAPVAIAGRPAIKARTQPRVEIWRAMVHGVRDRLREQDATSRHEKEFPVEACCLGVASSEGRDRCPRREIM